MYNIYVLFLRTKLILLYVDLLKTSVKSDNFQGIIICDNNGSRIKT